MSRDPYSSWPGAPKQWIVVPAQRRHPPVIRLVPPQAAAPRRTGGRGTVATVAVAVASAVAAALLAGPGAAVADLDGPAGATTSP